MFEIYGDLIPEPPRLEYAMIEEPEPLKVITVRLPKSLHQRLRSTAYGNARSLNQECIDRLSYSREVFEALENVDWHKLAEFATDCGMVYIADHLRKIEACMADRASTETE